MVSKYKFGSKLKYKGNNYFVTKAGVRVLEVRRVYADPNYPGGRLGHGLLKIKIKDL